MALTTAELHGQVPDRGTGLIVRLWVLTLFSTMTVMSRFLCRAQKMAFGWDDIFMLLSLLCFYGWSIVLTLLCVKGGQMHSVDVMRLGAETQVKIQLLNWTSQVFGIIGVAAGKISVAALLLAIMKDTHRVWQRTYLWTVCIGLVSAVAISCAVLVMTQCEPTAALWDFRIAGSCVEPKVMADYGIFTGSFNTFIYASLALVPWTIFWSLQMDCAEKITLCIVFSLNVLTCICSAIKTSYLFQLGDRTDFTWDTFDIFAWMTVELFLITVCGSIPTLKPLLSWLRRCYDPKAPPACSEHDRTSSVLEHSNSLDGLRIKERRTSLSSIEDDAATIVVDLEENMPNKISVDSYDIESQREPHDAAG